MALLHEIAGDDTNEDDESVLRSLDRGTLLRSKAGEHWDEQVQMLALASPYETLTQWTAVSSTALLQNHDINVHRIWTQLLAPSL